MEKIKIRKLENNMDMQDSHVKVRIARCGKCNNIVFASVEHLMDKQGHKEMAECVKAGCNVETMELLKFRSLKIDEWCNTECK